MRGNLRGSAVVGCLQYFLDRHGPAAMHAIVANLAPEHRALVQPNAPLLGLLPTRLYPYPMIGQLTRNMIQVIHAADEDVFLRAMAVAAMDSTLGTVNRLMLRWLVSPAQYAARTQEVWDLYHDSGRVKVLPGAANEFIVEISDWPNHDVTICKVVVESRRRILEKIGVRPIEARRSQCQAWGHPVCVQYLRWA